MSAPIREGRSAPVTVPEGVNLVTLAKELQPLVGLRPTFNGEVWADAGRKVGTLEACGVRIDVVPRMGWNNFAGFLRYALGAPLDPLGRSHIASGATRLPELLCDVLVAELADLRQRGLARRYESRSDRPGVLRGRPDPVASFPLNPDAPANVVCRYHELSHDNLDNRLILAALRRAVLMPTGPNTRRRLLGHLHAWSDLAGRCVPDREAFQRARKGYTRLTEHYRVAHRLAEMIHFGTLPSDLFDGGADVTSGVVLDMARLFELAVTRWLRATAAQLGMTVKAQARDRHAFLDGAGATYCEVRPDVSLWRGNAPVAVVDVKYKEYWEVRECGSPKTRVKSEDLYQVCFYAHRLQAMAGLPHPPPAVIVAPIPVDDRDACVGETHRLISWNAGSARGSCRLAFMCPETLSTFGGNALAEEELRTWLSTLAAVTWL